MRRLVFLTVFLLFIVVCQSLYLTAASTLGGYF